MTLDAVVQMIEQPFHGNMNGVSVLVCGADDNGRLAIKLARHSAAVVQLTESSTHFSAIEKAAPQALNLNVKLTSISDWIASNLNRTFDVIVSFDSYLSIIMHLSDCSKFVKLHCTSDGLYDMGVTY